MSFTGSFVPTAKSATFTSGRVSSSTPTEGRGSAAGSSRT
jgi:hypothetical protein